MKYIRTKDGRIIENKNYVDDRVMILIDTKTKKVIYKVNNNAFGIEEHEYSIIQQSDTIEELMDEFVLVDPYRFRKPKTATELDKDLEEMKDFYKAKDDKIYGAIWVKSGLKYVAKMNNKGKLCLL